MTKPEEFTVSEARPLPVILLLDSSGSMEGDKISILNAAVREMLQSFASEDDISAAIHVGVIQFGKTVGWHQPLLPVEDVLCQWSDLSAGGKTPLGQALNLLRDSLEDRNIVSSRAYRPTIVLVSDGKPTDDWGGPMMELLASNRASKAARFAMGIGADADSVVLSQFIDTTSGSKVFEAHEASRIQKFFRFVTMSVTTRTRSGNPNEIIPADPDDYDFDY
jgi:uncharacterized protein YegL